MNCLLRDHKTILWLLALSALVLSAACTRDDTREIRTVDVQIEKAHPGILQFSGKGAGVGMMLSSSMGAMGVPIGIAIDVGIAKEIENTAVSGGVIFEELLRDAFLDAIEKEGGNQSSAANSSGGSVKIIIDYYGFVTERGDNDPVAAKIELTMINATDEAITVNYPRDYRDRANIEIGVGNFEDIKSNPEVIRKVWGDALELLMKDKRVIQHLLEI